MARAGSGEVATDADEVYCGAPDMCEGANCEGGDTSPECAGIGVGDYCTYRQEAWGETCFSQPNSPACLRDAHFDSVFERALPECAEGEFGLLIGSDPARQVLLTDAGAVEAFLPTSGSGYSFFTNQPFCDPNPSYYPMIVGRSTALMISVAMSDQGILPAARGLPLGDLELVSGPCAGLSVRELLRRASMLISDQVPAGAVCTTPEDVSAAVFSVNTNFENCTTDLGRLRVP